MEPKAKALGVKTLLCWVAQSQQSKREGKGSKSGKEGEQEGETPGWAPLRYKHNEGTLSGAGGASERSAAGQRRKNYQSTDSIPSCSKFSSTGC